jgi:hypothetical protein
MHLPGKIRNEMENAEEIPTPEIIQPLLKYIEQLQIYLPQD